MRLDSTVIHAADHDADRAQLTVCCRDGRRHHCHDVSPARGRGLRRAMSARRHLATRIAPHHRHRRLPAR